MARAVRHAGCAVALAAVAITLPGCSNLGSFAGIPSVPVNRVPREFLGRSKAELVETNKLRLRQTPPEVYQLAANDVLGVYIENVIGNPEEAPPVHFPEEDTRAPSIGYPIPVREDGTIALPLVDPILIDGLTVNQATEAIRKAYTVDRQILQPGSDRIIVTLMRRRHYRVMVIREETGGIVQANSQSGSGISAKRGTGYAIDLPAYENDLLHALTETGGMPGLDAKSEVIIMRGNMTGAVDHDLLLAQLNNGIGPCGGLMPLPEDPNAIRIPLRFYPENPPRFTEENIILGEGDVVYVPSRENEKFYTGGVLGGGEFLLPRDYDLDILKAVAIARGPVGTSGSALQGISSGGGRFGGGGGGQSAVPPSRAIIIRKMPGMGEIPIRVDLNQALTDPSQRILIQPEDVIIVQYTCCEEIVNAALNIVQFNFLYGIGGQAFR
ncbi:MAG: polysaccharide biosynthesis/export family protein [Planctomycetaceae bacterium]|nr:polysaccharide biosynthesis/export family protein [Planctomycetaceae bacterium]